MARLIGPSEASREVKAIVTTNGSTKGLFKSKANRPATFYLDQAATQVADILLADGTPVVGGTVTIDAYSMLPLIQFPDGVDTLYVVVDGGPAWPVYAREDDQFDALETRMAALEPGGSGAALAASGNLSDVPNKATARTNLGLGTAATKNVGTTSADVAAGDAPAAAQAAAVQRANHTGTQAVSTVSGLQTALDAKAALSGYGMETVFPISFGTSANEKADIYFTGNQWATFEVTLVGIYSGSNASGVLRATYSLAGSSTGTVHQNSMQYESVQGFAGDHFALMPAAWDATNSRWKITVAHRTTTANSISVRVRWLSPTSTYSNNIRDSIGVSAVYTTDATVPTAPAISAVQKGELVLNALDFGVPNNNTGNAATGIQQAIDSFPTSGSVIGGTLLLPPGTYRLTTPIVLKAGVSIVGSGRRASRLHAASGSGVFTWTADLSQVVVRDLYLSSASGHIFAPTGDWGIYTTTVTRCVIVQQDTTKSIMHHVSARDYDNVGFFDCDMTRAAGATVPGFNIINSAGAANQNTWRDCWAHSQNSTGAPFFYVESTSVENYAYGNVFENITGEQCAGGLIDLRSNHSAVIKNCYDYDTQVTYTSDVIRIDKSAVGGLPTLNAHIETSGRRDNVTLPSGIYDLNLVTNGCRNATVVNANHSSTKFKISYSDADGNNILNLRLATLPSGQPTDAANFLQTTKVKALYIGDTATGVVKRTAGTGSPEGVVTGSVGDEYTRTDGTGPNIVYRKRSGTATNTGWVATGRTMPPPATLGGGRRLLSGFPFPSAIGTVALAKDTWRYMPLSLNADLTVNFLSVLCSVAPTGGTAAMVFGLWALNSAGQPTTRQADWSTYGSIDLTVGVGGEATLTTTGLVIPAGDWAIGCAWTGTATTNPTMFATTGAHPGVASNSIAQQTSAWSQSASGATPPSPASVAGAAAQGIAVYGVMA